MRILTLSIIICAFTSSFCIAQPQVVGRLNISATKSFFEQFTRRKEQTERGEFETNEEYQKRIAKPFDTTAVYYFKLETTPASSYKNYKYEIDAQKLSLIGGHCKNYAYYDYNPEGSDVVVILTRSESQGTYKASNAFGRTVMVEKSYLYDYVLSFANLDNVPDSVFRKDECTFTLSITAPPKAAEQMSKNLTLVIGVKSLGYQRSTKQCVLTIEPKIDSPSELSLFSRLIEVKFVSLFLYDESSKRILARFEIPK
jgi:hypothetical protein